jgi:hypothetical protein
MLFPFYSRFSSIPVLAPVQQSLQLPLLRIHIITKQLAANSMARTITTSVNGNPLSEAQHETMAHHLLLIL